MKPDTGIPGLESRRLLDPNTGREEIRYYWKRKPLEQVQLAGKLVEKMAGYTLIKKDLDSASRWMKKIEQLVPNDHRSDGFTYRKGDDRDLYDTVKGLFVAALTFYGKGYTTAEGRKAQLSRDWLEPEFQVVHDEYIKYRHNFAAHSGNELLERARTYLLIYPKKKKKVRPVLATSRYQPDAVLPSQGEKGLLDLIDHVSKILVQKHDKLAEKIVSELVLPKGMEFWHRAAKKSAVVTLELPRRGDG